MSKKIVRVKILGYYRKPHRPHPNVAVVYNAQYLAPTIMANGGGLREPTTVVKQINKSVMEEKKTTFKLPQELSGKKFRVRKLTERECFRLMDVDDCDIDKIQSTGISKSAQYKLAGNSIVVNCLYHLFRKMFVEKESEEQQLVLF